MMIYAVRVSYGKAAAGARYVSCGGWVDVLLLWPLPKSRNALQC